MGSSPIGRASVINDLAATAQSYYSNQAFLNRETGWLSV
jgi:hypothetical protein